MDGSCQHSDFRVKLLARGSQAHCGTVGHCVQGILVYLANEIANHGEKMLSGQRGRTFSGQKLAELEGPGIRGFAEVGRDVLWLVLDK